MRGHWEESFIGLEIKDLDNAVEVGHLIRIARSDHELIARAQRGGVKDSGGITWRIATKVEE
jgi:hypothetical protein